MKIRYSNHLKNRLELREIPYEMPKIIFNNPDEKYFDVKTKSYVAIKEVKFSGKIRSMMIVYEEKRGIVDIITIHPLKKAQKENRIKTRRWKTYE